MIVITTPTGHIGHQLLERVLNTDEPIQVIARDPSRLPELVCEHVEVVQDRATTQTSSKRRSRAPSASSGWSRRTLRPRTLGSIT